MTQGALQGQPSPISSAGWEGPEEGWDGPGGPMQSVAHQEIGQHPEVGVRKTCLLWVLSGDHDREGRFIIAAYTVRCLVELAVQTQTVHPPRLKGSTHGGRAAEGD